MKLRECDHRPAGLQLDDAAREHDDRRLRTSGIDLALSRTGGAGAGCSSPSGFFPYGLSASPRGTSDHRSGPGKQVHESCSWGEMPHLNLSEDEAAALIKALYDTINDDRYPPVATYRNSKSDPCEAQTRTGRPRTLTGAQGNAGQFYSHWPLPSKNLQQSGMESGRVSE